MKTDHTPGPWFVAKAKPRRVCGKDGVSICNAILRNQGGPKAKANLKDEHEAEANALLISAAPALLRLARENLSTLEVQQANHIRWNKPHAEIDAAINETRDIIASATGAA